MNKVDETLQDRGEAYGDFKEIAEVDNQFRFAAAYSGNFYWMDAIAKEAVLMTMHKLARIICSPYWKDKDNTKAKEHMLDSALDMAAYIKLGFPEAFETKEEEGE